MELTKIAGVDCKHGQCPAVFTTDRGSLAVQGYTVDLKAPDGEAIVEIPLDLLKEAVRGLGW